MVRNISQLRSFLAFMQAEDGKRFAYLHGLTLDVGNLPEDVAADLYHCITKLTNLRKLKLTWAEMLLNADQRQGSGSDEEIGVGKSPV